MSPITRLTPPPVSAYAPGAASTHLSEVTVEAIDRMGNETAAEMEATANAIEAAAGELAGTIMAQAKEVADDLRAKAKGRREGVRCMSQVVSNYFLWNAAARAAVAGIEPNIRQKMAAITNSEHDDGEPSPAFLHANGHTNGTGG